MIQLTLSASWDESSEFVLINRVHMTPLQVLALQLTEKLADAVDHNEVMLNYRNPKYVLAQASQREDRGGRRYDDRWQQEPQQQQQQYAGRRFRDDQMDRGGGGGFGAGYYRSHLGSGSRYVDRGGYGGQRRQQPRRQM